MPYITDEAWNVIGKIIHGGWQHYSGLSDTLLIENLKKYQSGKFDVCDNDKEPEVVRRQALLDAAEVVDKTWFETGVYLPKQIKDYLASKLRQMAEEE